MNTKKEWSTTATVIDPKRKVFWQSIFGTDKVPIVSFLTTLENLPGFDEPQPVYMLDLGAITEDQHQGLIEALARKFDLSTEFVARHLNDHGVPIHANDVTVASSDQGLLMSLIDDPT